jgi:hypothetical protein
VLDRRAFLSVCAGAGAGASLGCYTFKGGVKSVDVKTVAVLPFENETASPDLPRELAEALREALDKRLGLRAASEDRADAIMRGKIVRYELDVPVAVSADRRQATSARRRLSISVNLELVKQSDGKVLWQKTNLAAEGEYAERAELSGRKEAIQRIVSEVVDGAQSQW